MVGSGVLGLPLRLALLCPQKLYNNFFLLILTTQVHLDLRGLGSHWKYLGRLLGRLVEGEI